MNILFGVGFRFYKRSGTLCLCQEEEIPQRHYLFLSKGKNFVCKDESDLN